MDFTDQQNGLHLKEFKSFFPQFWWIFWIGKITGTWPFSFKILKPKLELQQHQNQNDEFSPQRYLNSKSPARSNLTIHYGFTIFYLSMTVLTFAGLPLYSYLVDDFDAIFTQSANITNNTVIDVVEVIIENTTESVIAGIEALDIIDEVPVNQTGPVLVPVPVPGDDEIEIPTGRDRLSQQVGLVVTVFVVIIGVVYLRILNLFRAKKARVFWAQLDAVVHDILDLYLSTPGLDHDKYKRLVHIQKIKVNVFLTIAIFGGFGVFVQSKILHVITAYFSAVPLPLAIFLAIVGIILCMETFIHCVYYLILYTIVKTISIAFKILKIQLENFIEEQQHPGDQKEFVRVLPVPVVPRSKAQQLYQNSKHSRQHLPFNPDAVTSAEMNGVDGQADKKVAKIIKLASALSDAFETFNETFKTQMLTFFWLIGIPMIFNLFLFFIHVWALKPIRPVLGQLTSFIRNYLVFAWICNAGQEISDVSSDIADSLGKVRIQNLSRETIHMLHFYHRRTLGNPLCISPGSYVTFNNELITSLYGAFITYLAILIQFNQPHSIDGSPD